MTDLGPAFGAVWLGAIPLSIYASRRHDEWLEAASTSRLNVRRSPVVLVTSAVLHTREGMIAMPVVTAAISAVTIERAGLLRWIVVSTLTHVVASLISIPLVERYEREVGALRAVPDVGSSYFAIGSLALLAFKGPAVVAIGLSVFFVVTSLAEFARLSIWRSRARPEAGDVGHVMAIVVGLLAAASAIR